MLSCLFRRGGLVIAWFLLMLIILVVVPISAQRAATSPASSSSSSMVDQQNRGGSTARRRNQRKDSDYATVVDQDGQQQQQQQEEGLQKIDLAFSGVQLEMNTKKKKDADQKRLLLDGSIHGQAKPGRMLAVMGPSGAGKVNTPVDGLSFILGVPFQTCVHLLHPLLPPLSLFL